MNNKQIIKKIIGSFIEEIGKKKFILISSFGVFVAILWMAEPFFYARIIDLVEQSFKTGVYDFEDYWLLFLYWGIFILVNSITFYIYRYYLVDVSVLDFHEELFRKYSKRIIEMSYGDFLNKKQGSLFKKFDRGISDHFHFMFFYFLDLIKNISGLFLIIVILFIIDYRMAFVTIAMLPVMIIMGLYFNRKTNTLQKEVNKDWDKSFGYIGDTLSNMGLVKTLVLEKVFGNLIKQIDRKAIKKQKKVSKRWSIADIYTGFLVMVSRFLVLSFGIYLLSKGEINFATLFLFFSFIGYIYFPLSFIFAKLRQLQEQLTSVDNFYEEFGNMNSDLELKKGINLKNVKGNIEFKNVNFGYTKDKKILKNLGFNIKSGEKIAFVGNTGAGKSTIVNLLFRFWDVKSGEILLDGEKINNISKDSLRKHIGLVAQDNSLFNTTIKQNMLFAKEKATKKEIEIALKKAQADFVFDLENGINTIIGERGLKLSGGEKQRLSIARLFLKNPEILVLDEATSALDNKTEKKVQKALDELMKNRTSIVIAHRLSTIQNSDRIFILENGKIIESGNYDELMRNKGKFHNLSNPEHLIIN